MSTAILDAEKRVQLGPLDESQEILDPQGHVVGRYLPEEEYRKLLYAIGESNCPISTAEWERRRKEKGGITLSELWKKLDVKS